MNNFKKHIKQILKADERLWYLNDETKETELNQTLLIDLAEHYDEKVLSLLFADETLKEKFFVKVGENYVFKSNDFQFFLEQNKVDNSYTKYKNRIGLSDGKRFLKDTKDVVLNFPFKDCILEGGQSTEEGQDKHYQNVGTGYQLDHSKRKEIFFNEVLAADEIDRLTDEKALVNFKRFDGNNNHVGIEQCSVPTNKGNIKINRDKNGTIQENLIIKGNNLLALHSLKKQFAKKVKLIYIDPPYNTGNDGFKYNDNFNHSTWLTFMKNRLEVARELLRDDGVIFVQCDDNEQAYLKVLMDEVFGRENFVNCVIWRKVLSAKKQSNYLSKIKEYCLIYSKKGLFQLNKVFLEAELKKDHKNYSYIEENTNRRYGSFDFTQKGQGEARYFDGKLLEPPKGKHWIWGQDKIDEGLQNNLIIFTKNGIPRVKRYLDEKEGDPLSDLWIDEQVKIISANDSQRIEFDGQKPEALLQRIIEIATQKGDIVLDYHLGSGTTAAVAHKMGRQYIGVEQMDYIEPIAVERLKKVIAGEQGGISKAVKWQGGGSFIYCELAKHNEQAKEHILACESLEELKTFFDEMVENYFLNYNLKIKAFQEQVINEEAFKNLSLEKQKQMFCTMLDNNQMYVCRSEMEDEKYGISEEDREMTREFYNFK